MAQIATSRLGSLPQLPLPSFYDPANAAKWDYEPDKARIFEEAQVWRKQFNIKPAATDVKRIIALLIDLQRDFCNPLGTLFVAGRSGTGSIDDARRTVEFIYRYLYLITKLVATLDTHMAYQIFLRSVFNKADGTPVGAFTEITAAMIESGQVVLSPLSVHVLANGNYQWLFKQMIYYCTELEKTGKYKLMIWPEHCFLGTTGHALLGIVMEAVLFHSYVRGSDYGLEIKGGNPLTENYSVLRPEVLTRWDGQPLAQKNTRLLGTLFSADYVLVPGQQAGSHCGASTIDDMIGEIAVKDPALARKVYICDDTASPVTIPDGRGGFLVDYTPQQEAAFARYSDAKMNVVKSIDPIDSWPGFAI